MIIYRLFYRKAQNFVYKKRVTVSIIEPSHDWFLVKTQNTACSKKHTQCMKVVK